MVKPVSASSISAGPISASDASLSPDGRYRWWLRRRWSTEGASLLFIGLNPSRADARADDPTLRRLIGFAKGWGYGELLVLNLFARRSPHPAALRSVTDPVGDRNDAVLSEQAERWSELALRGPLPPEHGRDGPQQPAVLVEGEDEGWGEGEGEGG